MDKQQLIYEAKKSSSAAQQQLFSELAPGMHSLCRRYVKSIEDAEEVMLDGFFNFFKSISRFHYHSDAALYVWVKKIMINQCLMFLRRKNLFVIVSEASATEIPVTTDVLDRLSSQEIFQLILQLPPGYRTVFNLYELEDFSHREIAKMLGISEGTSKSQLSKAKATLQKLVIENHLTYGQRQTK